MELLAFGHMSHLKLRNFNQNSCSYSKSSSKIYLDSFLTLHSECHDCIISLFKLSRKIQKNSHGVFM